MLLIRLSRRLSALEMVSDARVPSLSSLADLPMSIVVAFRQLRRDHPEPAITVRYLDAYFKCLMREIFSLQDSRTSKDALGQQTLARLRASFDETKISYLASWNPCISRTRSEAVSGIETAESRGKPR